MRLFALVLALAGPAAAQCRIQELVPSAPIGMDAFGTAVAVDGARLLVGARGDDDAGIVAGAAYVFEPGGSSLVEVAKLPSSTGGPFDDMGISVALEGERALLGAPSRLEVSSGSGGVGVVFDGVAGAWSETGRLFWPGVSINQGFGNAVALSPASAVIAGPRIDTAGPDSGAVHVHDLARIGDAFVSCPEQLSISSGGRVDLVIDTRSGGFLRTYAVLGTLSGTTPGLTIPTVGVLPLDPDGYFTAAFESPGIPLFEGTTGLLGTTGRAWAALNVPAALDPRLAGFTAHHAAIVLDPLAGTALEVTNAGPLVLTP